MLSEFQLATEAKISPHGCYICGNQKGPFTDTLVDKFGAGINLGEEGRVYLCRPCTRLAAKAHGLVKGERMDELLDAADKLEQKEKEIADRDKYVDGLNNELAETKKQVRALRDLLDASEKREASRSHLASIIDSTTKQLLEVS